MHPNPFLEHPFANLEARSLLPFYLGGDADHTVAGPWIAGASADTHHSRREGGRRRIPRDVLFELYVLDPCPPWHGPNISNVHASSAHIFFLQRQQVLISG